MQSPLSKPLHEWTNQDAQHLIGASEGQRLELKGPKLNLGDSADRLNVAREIAAMASTIGGFIVLGARGRKVLKGFAGHGAGQAGLAGIRDFILEKVRPTPQIDGPREFTDGTHSIAVIEVLPNSLGEPSSVDGQFFTRSDEVRRPMSREEIEARLRAPNLGEKAMEEACALSMIRASTTDQILHMALVPIGSRDLGLTGHELVSALRTAVKADDDAAKDILRDQSYRIMRPVTARADGAYASGNEYAYRVGHDAVTEIRLYLHYFAKHLDTGGILLKLFDVAVLRAVGLGLRTHRELGVGQAGALALSAWIGDLVVPEPTTTGETSLRPHAVGGPFHFQFTATPWSPPATIRAETRVFLQRVMDNAPEGFAELALLESGEEYLARMLRA